MNYLITGGCGFIGGHLVEMLLQQDKNATILVIDPDKAGIKVVSNHVTYYNLPLQSFYMDRVTANKKPDYIFHLGAISNVRESMLTPASLYEQNVYATAYLLEGVLTALNRDNHKVKGIAFASSSACLEPRESHYGISKFCCEEMFNVFSQQTKIPCASLRFGNVIGERQNPKNGTIIPTWIEKFIANETLQIYGDGEQLRDYVGVKDVCRCLIHAVQKEYSGIFNVSTGTLHSVNDIKRIFDIITHHKCQFEYVDAKAGDKASVVLPPDASLPTCYDESMGVIYDALCWRMTQKVGFSWDEPIIITT